jgi:hypothetical protein
MKQDALNGQANAIRASCMLLPPPYAWALPEHEGHECAGCVEQARV